VKIATVAVAYNEARFIRPHLAHIPTWVDEKLVLVSTKPWNGEAEPDDGTAEIARASGATVIEHDWTDETEQRNAGQEYLADYDWIIVLDPDEFLDELNWGKLFKELYLADHYDTVDAFVIKHQRVFYKHSEASPHSDYQQLIAVRPYVRFVDKRVVSSPFAVVDVELLHFSWARTNEEVWHKLSHYGHAHDFDTKRWYEEVWLTDKTTNLHPLTPETLQALIKPELPPEIEALNLWP
jgi:glycosyltransferase involved in cell wall biosynthesis